MSLGGALRTLASSTKFATGTILSDITITTPLLRSASWCLCPTHLGSHRCCSCIVFCTPSSWTDPYHAPVMTLSVHLKKWIPNAVGVCNHSRQTAEVTVAYYRNTECHHGSSTQLCNRNTQPQYYHSTKRS